MGWTYNRRLQDWFEDLAQAVSELQDTLDDWPSLDELARNEVFADAVINASRAAQATHQAEKRVALRNGVLNSIDADAPSVDEQARFFRLVDEFSPAHLRLLKILSDPKAAGLPDPGLMKRGGVRGLIRQLADFRDAPTGWIELLAKDLEVAGLTSFGPLGFENKYGETLAPIATQLGWRFLQFIERPTPTTSA